MLTKPQRVRSKQLNFKAAAIALIAVNMGIARGANINSYVQTNLVSDLPGVAANQDPDLVNPWGLVQGPTPFWAADNGTGKSTLYTGSGTKLGLVVTLPAAGSDPTGIVFNGTSGFGGDHFIFATESGTIVGWSSGTTAAVTATGAAGSIYKGLGISSNLVYAANFGLGRIDVFDTNFNPVSTTGNFKDPTLPAGYAPFNIQNLGGNLYVTYAKTSGGTDEVDGPGLGFVSEFKLNGTFVKRIATQGALNAPWGLAVAPSNFGAFSSDLLVGNFGDGKINAYNPTTGTMVGTLDGINGSPFAVPGLWGLSFGNGSAGTSPNSLYFNAGIAGPGNVEDHGLFGGLTVATPEPGTLPVFIGVFLLMLGAVAFRSRKAYSR
jgi:uncharacterized protein (TIGR03118 family)